MSKTYKIAFWVLLGMMSATVYLLLQQPWKAGASVPAGNAYLSTTTPQVADLTNLCPQQNNIASSTTGTLGAINVLSSGQTGYLVIYDATTTNNSLRMSMATTSMILAWLPLNASSTSYHFDIEFNRGLLIDYTTGVATTTISYRCGS